jgi:hypothetical protein
MLNKEDFVRRILDKTAPPPKRASKAELSPPTFSAEDVDWGSSDDTTTASITPPADTRFAQLLLEEVFGHGEALDRDEVVLGEQKTCRLLPNGGRYWPKTNERPFHIVLFELDKKGRELLDDAFFRQQDLLEDALHRIVQDVLDGFEKKRTASARQGAQTETLCVVSIVDDRSSSAGRQIVCFGTKSTTTGDLEVFTLREEVRDWDRPLAEEHLEQLFSRHFEKLASGAKWQDAFITGAERKKIKEFLAACTQGSLLDIAEDNLRQKLRDVLDEIAGSFGINRKIANQNRRLDMVELPVNHGIGADPTVSQQPGFKNPLQGVRIYDRNERLLGFIVYVASSKAKIEPLREALATNNHFHNVLVIYPDSAEPELKLWQGSTPLRGRLTRGPKRTQFDGEGGVVQLLSRFFVVSKSAIEKPKQLATELAWRAQHLKALAVEELEKEIASGNDNGPLKELFDTFNAALATLTVAKFADAYAQTITYGMLAARWISSGESPLFTRKNLKDLLPETSAFLKDLFDKLVNSNFDKNLSWLLDDITSLLARTSVVQVFQDEKRDPSIHFYEDFLDAYDPLIRKEQGVYYTPDEVVSYIVRTTHTSLQHDFGLPLGLADTTTWAAFAKAKKLAVPEGVDPKMPFVQVLDPALGTGTFLLRVIEVIHETMLAEFKKQGLDDEAARKAWVSYVRKDLLPRINGFELMMAPYIVSHLRLGLALQETGFTFAKNDRLRVFLTNTLEPHTGKQLEMLGANVADESRQAEETKVHTAITVLVGNPPYAAVSQNNGEWIVGLLKGVSPSDRATGSYYEIDGQPLGEKKLWLNDDYVKFIRMAQWRIECSGLGVVGMVTNNGYLSNPTFRGMRQQLMHTFPRIEVIDLNGSTKNRRRIPQGVTDENVFQIQQGVAIAIMVRSASPSSTAATPAVRHRDVWGLRKEKLTLLDGGVGVLAALAPCSPYYFFFPWQAGGSADFSAFIKVTDLMTTSTTGFITARDGLVVGFDAESLLDRIKEFRDVAFSDATIRSRFFGGRSEGKYPPGDTRGWKLSDARKKVAADSQWRAHTESCLYRPFDTRQVYYAPWMVDWPREDVFVHLRPVATNRCLMVCRQIVSPTWSHVLVADRIVDDSCVSNKSRERGYAFPLYLSPETDAARRVINFAETAVARFEQTLGPRSKWSASRRATSWPELLFDYIVAILHSPGYRKRYLDMLQVDFPRIPVPRTLPAFQELSELGRQLASAYLLEVSAPANLARFNGTDREVTKVGETGKTLRLAAPSASQGRLFVNATSYFDAVPVTSWKLTIGAYQVCHKWLDDRRKSERSLSDEEIATFRAIVAACGRLVDVSSEIDHCIDRAGGWSSLFTSGSVSDE